MPELSQDPILEARTISKEFWGVPVLKDVSLSVQPGEVLAVVGENGAGKSTLMKILAGVLPHGSYSGDVVVAGERVAFSGTREAEAAGVVMIPQELHLAKELTVAENLFLGVLPGRGPWVNWSQLFADARQYMMDFGLELDVSVPMKYLMPAQQQLVEVVKALHRGRARVLILDEPTASLSRREADLLFDYLDKLKARGVTSVYISHRIDEVQRVADRVAVLRDGCLVGIRANRGLSHADIVAMMLGRNVEQMFPVKTSHPADVVFQVRNLVVQAPGLAHRDIVKGINFDLRAGEVVGLFGLVGSGRTEAAMGLFGAWTGNVTGEITIAGERVVIHEPSDAINHGVALLTEDRKVSGLVQGMGVSQNISLASLDRVARGPLLDHLLEVRQAARFVKALRIKAAHVRAPVRSLSGGNQQKVVLAKWLATNPKVLILDEPTQGIDVGAKAEIYRELNLLAEHGVGTLFISSELLEVLGVSDRILVMYQGRIVGEFSRSEADEERVLHLATGGQLGSGAAVMATGVAHEQSPTNAGRTERAHGID